MAESRSASFARGEKPKPVLDLQLFSRWPPLELELEASAAAAALEARPSSQLRLATWNVWFDAILQLQRMAALMREILIAAPDVVCLQEVVPEFASSLRSCESLTALYDISPFDVTTHGTLMLVRKRMKVIYEQKWLPGDMGRAVIIARVKDEQTPSKAEPRMVLATAHLESLDNEKTRRDQLHFVASLLEDTDHIPAVFCGDFNFDAAQTYGDWRRPKPLRSPDQLENHVLAELLPSFVDVWPSVRDDEGFTFDGSINVQCVHDVDERMRYDRVLVRRGDSLLTATGACLMGTEAINNWGLRPSDHFGLLADMSFSSPSQSVESTTTCGCYIFSFSFWREKCFRL